MNLSSSPKLSSLMIPSSRDVISRSNRSGPTFPACRAVAVGAGSEAVAVVSTEEEEVATSQEEDTVEAIEGVVVVGMRHINPGCVLNCAGTG